MATNNFYDNRDQKFILKEWLDTEKVISCTAFKDYYSMDDIDTYLDQGMKMAREVLAPTNDEADKIGAKFLDGRVETPPSFKKAYQTITEAGLGAHFADREAEGRLPLLFVNAINEMFSMGCSSIIHYWGLTAGAARVIQDYADEKYKKLFLPKMFSGEWGGTMNLTEPSAGSDVGDLLSRAYLTDQPGLYRIKGVKQFITCGDHDLTENIIHLVLARIEGARQGTSGLSLFIVPKYWVNDDGNIGELNDVQTVGVEHKMGYRGSATCALSYGENNGCLGYLIGEPPGEDGKGHGIAQMFKMMNEERMNVCTMSLSLANLAYRNSLEYAKQRVQGRLLTDPKGERQTLIKHEDIRRMLLMQKSCVEAIRALLFQTVYYLDLANDSDDPEEREFAEMMSQINIPLCKAYASDMSWRLIAEAIQIYGGYGYTEDYPVAQAARDSKIHSIWEGTSYIQSMDLTGRKFTMKGGQPFAKWLSQISAFVENNRTRPGFEREMDMLFRGLGGYQEILGLLQQYMKEGNVSMLPLFATRILHATSTIYCGYLLMSQALVAGAKLEEIDEYHYDRPFYQGKLAAARFYIMNMVPKILATKASFETRDFSALEISEEAF